MDVVIVSDRARPNSWQGEAFELEDSSDTA